MESSAASDLVEAVLAATFADGVPTRIDALVDRAASGRSLTEFSLSPVLGNDGTTRIACADTGGTWLDRVAAGWPAAAPFLAEVPDCRRMIDSDGTDAARAYLDDLHDRTHSLKPPGGHPLMALVQHLPGDARTWMTRHTTPPLTLVPEALTARIQLLLQRGAEGAWSVHWTREGAQSVMWISESRWRGDAAHTREIAEPMADHPAWARLSELAAANGLIAYPDAIELYPDRWDLTVGFAVGRLDP